MKMAYPDLDTRRMYSKKSARRASNTYDPLRPFQISVPYKRVNPVRLIEDYIHSR